MDSEWGYVTMPDGTTVPLDEPTFSIPEQDRQYLVNRPGLSLWTAKDDDNAS